MRARIYIPRPQHVDLSKQGKRGPFAPLLIALNAATDINEWTMRQHDFPLLYEAGVKYQPEDLEHNYRNGYEEDIKDVVELYRTGHGDCDDIATVRAAELRVKFGIQAVPCIMWKFITGDDGKKVLLIHVLVMLPDGTIEDPCVVLGMEPI